jgi:hypothetical protein
MSKHFCVQRENAGWLGRLPGIPLNGWLWVGKKYPPIYEGEKIDENLKPLFMSTKLPKSK